MRVSITTVIGCLLLVEIAPERANALLAWARAFGNSRLVCNAHWQSDRSPPARWRSCIRMRRLRRQSRARSSLRATG